VDAPSVLRQVRTKAGLTLRELAGRAETSHATLSAYEAGRVAPGVATFDRIVRAAGFAAEFEAAARVRGDDRMTRGEELLQVLDLAARFPARHAPTLEAPVFGRR
jgi:transcriptional regulator with XRE-family HTH domain